MIVRPKKGKTALERYKESFEEVVSRISASIKYLIKWIVIIVL